MSSDSKKWLILPMEIVEREFNGYLMLAIEAARRGWGCILGTKKEIFEHYDVLPKGVVFLKSATTVDIGNIQRLKNAGHTPVSQDVEGLIYTSMEEFAMVRFHEDSLKNLERVFFWGHVQRDAIASYFPDFSNKMIATGSPVPDTWHPSMYQFYKDKIDDIRGRFGKYILIPSSFGSVNHYMGRQGNADLMKRGGYVKEELADDFYKFWESYENHLEKILHAFFDILPFLSKEFPEHEIIVRPHPSESHESWKAHAKDLGNVTVIFEGTVAPWLLGADAILHWGCTTAVEGYLMGKPVVAYNPSTPEEDEKYEHKLPHSISIVTRTKKDTLDAIKEVIKSPQDILSKYCHVAEGDKDLQSWIIRPEPEGRVDSSHRIMDHIEALNVTESRFKAFVRRKESPKERVLQFMAQLLSHLSYLTVLLPPRIRLSLESRAYGKHKTRQIERETVNASLQKLCKIKDVKNIESQKLHQNLFLITGK